MMDAIFAGSSLPVLITALLLDHGLGEVRRLHPLVGFGRLAQAWEHQTNHGGDLARFFKGALGILLLIAPLLFALQFVAAQLERFPDAVQGLWEALILYFCLGFKSLREHTTPIANALQALRHATPATENDLLHEARTRTAWIVSRDTDSLDEQQCARAAVESLLENGNDALFATLFWAALLGPAGAVLHRLINTLDAMWGYRTQRFEWFGKCAARADDLLAWVPARLTAVSYCLVGNLLQGIRCWRTQAHTLKSPNGGPCMTAGAGSLSVTLGGAASYHGKWIDKPVFGQGHAPGGNDILRAQRLLWRALMVWLVTLALLTPIVSFAGGLPEGELLVGVR
jgi:adenosylcobinamide-phosphate synthase